MKDPELVAWIHHASDTSEVWNMYTAFSGRLAFDIGANGGLVANILSKSFETVIAVEPAEESFRRLLEKANPNVHPVHLAISDHEGLATFRETSLTASLGQLFTGYTLPWGETTGHRNLPCITLDQLRDTYGQPDFIKIDTEGHESLICAGGVETFRNRPAFIIEIHSSSNGSRVESFLSEYYNSIEVVHHEAYHPNSAWYTEHYWLVYRG